MVPLGKPHLSRCCLFPFRLIVLFVAARTILYVSETLFLLLCVESALTSDEM